MVEGLPVEAARLEDVGGVDEGEALREAGVVVDSTGQPLAVEPASLGVGGKRNGQECR